MNQNQLKPENCNKVKCKSCIFGPNPVHLSEERKREIINYLSKFESSHVCHVTDKTCYGALEFQARILFYKKIIPEPTVESLLKEAQKFIK